jgi:hypothetical protein
LKPSVEDLISQLKEDAPTFIAEVNALATKDEPAVLAVVTKYVDEVPIPGFFGSMFGGEVKSLVVGYATSELTSLLSEGETLEPTAFDALIVKLEAVAAEAGL